MTTRDERRQRKAREIQAIRAEITDPRHDEAAALEAMRAVFAVGPTLKVDARPSGPLVGRGPGAVQKVSPSGKHIGWYREGQRSGKPSLILPSEADMRRAEAAHLEEIHRVGKEVGAVTGRTPPSTVVAGKASGKARQERPKNLIAEFERLRAAGKSDAQARAVAANTFKVTKRHAQRLTAKKKAT